MLVAAMLFGSACGAWAGGPDVADPSQALSRLGPPGFLWGRLSVEEESPDGAWTPLAGVEVVVYPYVPPLMAQLERIRASARDSGRQHDTAVARLQEALQTYKLQVDTASGRPVERREPAPARKPKPGPVTPEEGSGGSGEEGMVRRRLTDRAGVFVFDALPSGEWLLVAIRTSPYPTMRARREEPRGPRARESQFAGRPAGSVAKEAEVWMTRVRVEPGERVRVFWTDRARFMVGPLR